MRLCVWIQFIIVQCLRQSVVFIFFHNLMLSLRWIWLQIDGAGSFITLYLHCWLIKVWRFSQVVRWGWYLKCSKPLKASVYVSQETRLPPPTTHQTAVNCICCNQLLMVGMMIGQGWILQSTFSVQRCSLSVWLYLLNSSQIIASLNMHVFSSLPKKCQGVGHYSTLHTLQYVSINCSKCIMWLRSRIIALLEVILLNYRPLFINLFFFSLDQIICSIIKLHVDYFYDLHYIYLNNRTVKWNIKWNRWFCTSFVTWVGVWRVIAPQFTICQHCYEKWVLFKFSHVIIPHQIFQRKKN